MNVTRFLPSRILVVPALLSWAAACNAVWGIEEGNLAIENGAHEAGAGRGGSGGSGTREGGDAIASRGGWHVDSGSDDADADDADALGEGGAPQEAGDDDASDGSGMTGGEGGSAGSGGSGGTPPCTGCAAGDVDTQHQACGRCGTGNQTRTRTCDDHCTWSGWSEWSKCSQCLADRPWRCCGSGSMWEWCYDSNCDWTGGCAPCSGCGCPE